MVTKASKRRETWTALAFLLPNMLGVLTFVVFPVLFAIMLAFSNWDLRLHNMFKSEPLEFVGIDNFVRLFTEADFLRFLGNTLFLMMGIPFAVGGALFSAIFLSKDTRGGGGRVYLYLIAAAVLVISVALLADYAGAFLSSSTVFIIHNSQGTAYQPEGLYKLCGGQEQLVWPPSLASMRPSSAAGSRGPSP